MARKHVDRVRQMTGARPANRAQLADWMRVFLWMKMPGRSVCEHHDSPLDYLAHAFLEERDDAVVWACRGGGKTMVGAVATLLDLIFKPGIEVRILGGSLEQSEKMYAYLRTLMRRHFAHLLAGPPTNRRLVLINGSRVDVLAQSDRSVRGQRVQKLRCDEVELFDPEVWQAAQLTTRSRAGVRGAVEAFSTMHKPGGLMQNLLNERTGRKVFAWCIWDVIERCPAARKCAACPLFADCQGRAKAARGFVKIDDVIAIRGRISRATWEHEMLCKPPRFEDAVFPAFRREIHVRGIDPGRLVRGSQVDCGGRPFTVESVVCGVDFGRVAFVCLWIVMLRSGRGERAAWVVDELVASEQTLSRNAAAMRARSVGAMDPAVVYCDVAGRQANSHTLLTDERVLRGAGFVTRSRSMHIDDGLGLISDLVDPAEGAPRLLIDPRCRRLIEAMEGYRRGRDGSAQKDGRHDHLIDALRYALVNHDGAKGKLEVRLY